jgi:hypothetical protein
MYNWLFHIHNVPVIGSMLTGVFVGDIRLIHSFLDSAVNAPIDALLARK